MRIMRRGVKRRRARLRKRDGNMIEIGSGGRWKVTSFDLLNQSICLSCLVKHFVFSKVFRHGPRIIRAQSIRLLGCIFDKVVAHRGRILPCGFVWLFTSQSALRPCGRWLPGSATTH